MKLFSLGFIFNNDLSSVLLIHKNRPEWQKGLLNGIGGKVENDESHLMCIVRETSEETNLSIPAEDWIQFASISDTYGYVEVYAARYAQAMDDAVSVEDQQVEWIRTDTLPTNVIKNLTWLIPAAMDRLKNKAFHLKIQYS